MNTSFCEKKPHENVLIKRDGRRQSLHVDKLSTSLRGMTYDLNTDFINVKELTPKIVANLASETKAEDLSDYVAQYTSTLAANHPDFGALAGRIAISNLHKNTSRNFSDAMKRLYEHKNAVTGVKKPLIAKDVYDIIMANKEELDSAIVRRRDYDLSYFGFRTLERAYLLRDNEAVVETPQYMFMRVAVGIHKEDIGAAIETYEYMSGSWFTHATPTLFNAGRPRPQLSSCFLLSTPDDSIEGIYEALKRCALISKYGGGIGINVHNVRAAGSTIDGVSGAGTGLLPMLRNFNNTATYVNQGGKRPGAFAVYLEPWHADVFEFVQLRLNVGPEEIRCRDLFLALWIPDLFMKRVETDSEWSLMSPDDCPGLVDSWGEEFEQLYKKYEDMGRIRRRVKARELWRIIINSQCETGLPYMLFKDACNRKSNQQNLGTIRCSNLCTEIVQFTNAEEVAVCNLASIALNRFVIEGEDGKTPPKYNFEELRKVTKIVTRNLNKVIDVNFYPIPEAENSNKKHRPIGIGVQGLADAFMLMRYPFTSPEARDLNKKIFETIYFGALEASCELAKEFGPYASYAGSPVSQGILQYDMWGVTPSNLWDWAALKEMIAMHGVRNSLLVAPMPTASTAQILGNNEAFEPYTSNMYTRRVTRGDFQVVNKHLVRDLIKLGLWNKETQEHIIMQNGSVQELPGLPEELKELYKTVWEMRQVDLIQMAADRGPFIDQSQSLNLFVSNPNFSNCTTMYFKAWKLGLKTGMYYLRSKPSVNPVKFSIKRSNADEVKEDDAPCEMCSS